MSIRPESVVPSKRELVTPSVIEWAINESGYDYAEIAKHLKADEAVIKAWSNGIDRPTTRQLTKLTAKLKRRHSLFFRPSVPPSASLPPELRTAAGRGPFPNERLEIGRARRVQRFVAALSERDVPSSIPIHEIGASPNAIAGCPVVVPRLAPVALRRHDGVPIERGGEAAGDGALVRRGPSAGRARPARAEVFEQLVIGRAVGARPGESTRVSASRASRCRLGSLTLPHCTGSSGAIRSYWALVSSCASVHLAAEPTLAAHHLKPGRLNLRFVVLGPVAPVWPDAHQIDDP